MFTQKRVLFLVYLHVWVISSYLMLNKLISGQELLLGSTFVLSKKVWKLVRDDIRLRTDLWEDLEIGLLAGRVWLSNRVVS
jgi:hypothetical protein